MPFEPEEAAAAWPGRFWYLASPYSRFAEGLDAAAAAVARIAGLLIARGICVQSPIAHSHAIARAAGLDPLSHDLWLPVDRPLADAACGLVVAALPGWRDSYGVGQELEWFATASKPRFLMDPATLVWRPIR